MKNIKIGEKVFGFNSMVAGQPCAELEMVENALYLYCGLPHITDKDVQQFKESKYEFYAYGDSNSGLSLILMKGGRDVMELPFNVNLYPDDRFEKFQKANTSIVVQVFDSSTLEIKAIRILSLNEQLKTQFVDLWKATVDKGISQAEYDEWLNEVFTRDVEYNFRRSRKLGYIKYGYNTKELVYMQSL